MENKYQVKIEDSVIPELYTFDQLIDEGLLDEIDEKIKVRLNGEEVWQIARSYPFADKEHRSREQQTYIFNHVDHKTLELPNSHSQLLQIENPPIIGKWNWGAFSLSWIWGIFNGLYWPIIIIALNFIPYIGLFCSFIICLVLGYRGNELAWRIARKNGNTIGDFTDRQMRWNITGFFLTIIIVCSLIVIATCLFIKI